VLHSITLSARRMTDSGIDSPRDFAVLRFKKFKFCRLFNRQVGRVSALKNFVHILRRLAEHGLCIRAITRQSTGFDK
jgi:hypothetical protein